MEGDEMDLSPEIVRFIQEELATPYNTVATYERYFIAKLQNHSILCTTTIATVNIILAPLISKHTGRFFCRLDDTHTIKSPTSIIEKILRSRKEEKKRKEKGEPGKLYDLTNFTREMKDLARFRIVCNFLADVTEVAECIRQSIAITDFFEITDINSITQHRRVSGERSIKLILKRKSPPELFLEIQVMTQLQEAWDKKDHYLVYEKRRSSSSGDDDDFPTYLDAKMSAMAELLYVADDYFDRLRKEEDEQEACDQ
jgi:ppGpp synthetase/RelA/SpoT-type nucleotidyltranferase